MNTRELKLKVPSFLHLRVGGDGEQVRVRVCRGRKTQIDIKLRRRENREGKKTLLLVWSEPGLHPCFSGFGVACQHHRFHSWICTKLVPS